MVQKYRIIETFPLTTETTFHLKHGFRFWYVIKSSNWIPCPPELIGNSKSILSSPDDFSFPIVPKAWPGTMWQRAWNASCLYPHLRAKLCFPDCLAPARNQLKQCGNVASHTKLPSKWHGGWTMRHFWGKESQVWRAGGQEIEHIQTMSMWAIFGPGIHFACLDGAVA